MRPLLLITKALADLNRMRIVLALAGGELCVCQLQELLALAPSTTSKHLSILTNAGLLEMRKEGRWAYYRLTALSTAPPPVADALRWAEAYGSREKVAEADRARLARILAVAPEELAQMQARGERCCGPDCC